jgi:hypothetical protein
MINKYDTSIKPLAVVTCASKGVGLELAKQFAKNGYDLIVVAENASIVEVAEELKEYGVDAISLQLNLASEEGVEILTKKIISLGRQIEVAAINQVNPTSFVILAEYLKKAMLAQGFGRILFNSTKESGFVKDSRIELHGSNVTITTLTNHELNDENTDYHFIAQEAYNSLMAGAPHVDFSDDINEIAKQAAKDPKIVRDNSSPIEKH